MTPEERSVYYSALNNADAVKRGAEALLTAIEQLEGRLPATTLDRLRESYAEVASAAGGLEIHAHSMLK